MGSLKILITTSSLGEQRIKGGRSVTGPQRAMEVADGLFSLNSVFPSCPKKQVSTVAQQRIASGREEKGRVNAGPRYPTIMNIGLSLIPSKTQLSARPLHPHPPVRALNEQAN